MKSKNCIIVIFIFFISFLLSTLISFQIGITWDEPFYIVSGIRHIEWFKDFDFDRLSASSINHHWFINHEHPPLSKLFFGLSVQLFQKTIGILHSARLVNSLLLGVLCSVVFLIMKKRYSTISGYCSIVFLLLCQRFIHYSSIATLDFSLSVFWFLTMISYYYGQNNKKYFVLSVLLFSLSNLIKFNANFMLSGLLIWGLMHYRSKVLKHILVFFIISNVLFVLLWPWLYHDTGYRLFEYAHNKIGRVEIIAKLFPKQYVNQLKKKPPSKVPAYYMNRVYKKDNYPAPFHYPLVYFLASLPVFLLCLLIYSLFLRIKNKDDLYDLSIVNILVSLGIFMIPSIPKYGGVRFFLHVYPFAVIPASIGMHQMLKKKTTTVKLILLLLFLISVSHLFFNFPFFNNYRNVFFSLNKHLKTMISHETPSAFLSSKVIEQLNKKLPQDSKLYIHPACSYVVDFYEYLNYFRKDIQLVKEIESADFICLINHPAQVSPEIKNEFKNMKTIIETKKSNEIFCQIFAVN